MGKGGACLSPLPCRAQPEQLAPVWLAYYAVVPTITAMQLLNVFWFAKVRESGGSERLLSILYARR